MIHPLFFQTSTNTQVYRHLCTIREHIEAQRDDGSIDPGVDNWPVVSSLQNLPCVVADMAAMSRPVIRKEDLPSHVQNERLFHCSIAGLQPAINIEQRAEITVMQPTIHPSEARVMSGIYDIVTVQHDSQSRVTRLVLRKRDNG
jgi:hypothetical protein